MTPDETALMGKVTAALPAADAAVNELEGILKAGDLAALGTFADKALYPAIDPVTAISGP